jgi:predicted dehydrogenase
VHEFPKVRAFATAEALLGWPDCDAVIISTPPDSHAELAVSAMMNGKHVLAEKPIANTVISTEHMLRTAEKTGRTLTVG